MIRSKLLPGLAALLLSSASAFAQDPPKEAPKDPPKPWRRGELMIGGYVAELNSNLQVISGTGLGATVDVEEALGLDESLTQYRIQASFLLADRHRLFFDYVDLSRKATRTIDANITIDDTVYPIGTTVDTEFDLQLINMVYGYSLLYDDRMDIGLTFGIHHLRVRFEAESKSGAGAETERFMLPIPLPGFRAMFALTPELFLRQSLEILYLPFDKFQGLYVDTTIALEWTPFKHLGFGLGWNSTRIRMEMEDEDFPRVEFEGKFQYDVAGVMLYTILYF
jgi:hypothetical protein